MTLSKKKLEKKHFTTEEKGATFGDKNQKKREGELNTNFQEMINKSKDPEQIKALKKLMFK